LASFLSDQGFGAPGWVPQNLVYIGQESVSRFARWSGTPENSLRWQFAGILAGFSLANKRELRFVHSSLLNGGSESSKVGIWNPESSPYVARFRERRMHPHDVCIPLSCRDPGAATDSEAAGGATPQMPEPRWRFCPARSTPPAALPPPPGSAASAGATFSPESTPIIQLSMLLPASPAGCSEAPAGLSPPSPILQTQPGRPRDRSQPAPACPQQCNVPRGRSCSPAS
jgi:hypothetical protein